MYLSSHLQIDTLDKARRHDHRFSGLLYRREKTKREMAEDEEKRRRSEAKTDMDATETSHSESLLPRLDSPVTVHEVHRMLKAMGEAGWSQPDPRIQLESTLRSLDMADLYQTTAEKVKGVLFSMAEDTVHISDTKLKQQCDAVCGQISEIVKRGSCERLEASIVSRMRQSFEKDFDEAALALCGPAFKRAAQDIADDMIHSFIAITMLLVDEPSS